MKREKKGKDESVWRVEILPKDPPNKKTTIIRRINTIIDLNRSERKFFFLPIQMKNEISQWKGVYVSVPHVLIRRKTLS